MHESKNMKKVFEFYLLFNIVFFIYLFVSSFAFIALYINDLLALSKAQKLIIHNPIDFVKGLEITL